MKSRLRLVLAGALVVSGCKTARNVAVSSYHAVTAPARLVNRQIDRPSNSSTATDVANPGHPVVVERGMTPTPSPRQRRRVTEAMPQPSEAPRTEPVSPQFPTAKAVSDKPGYVYSPDDPSKYVDVTGYPSGSKVKDPYSGKIFLVP